MTTDQTLDAPFLAAPRGVAGRYHPIALLGRGGFGTVHRATDSVTGQVVALKVMTGLSSTALGRLRREIAALRLLRVPGVVRLLDDGVEGDTAFLVMELIEGQPFPGTTGRRWEALERPTLTLLEALSEVHAAGVVHRDLKPPNVLVRPDGRAVLLDFGIALGPGAGESITRTGAMVATPRYAAPEQLRGDDVDHRADLYAAGLMLREALTGALPFDSADPAAGILRRLGTDAPPISRAVDAPAHVLAVIDALLEREPSRRPRSAAEVAERLRGARTAGQLPWLGPETHLDHAVSLLRAGHSVRLEGPPGSGRTRALASLGDRLATVGCAVLAATRGNAALESLPSIAAQCPAEASLQEVEALAYRALLALRTSGGVVLADDPELLDPTSRRLLARLAVGGGVASAGAALAGRRVALPRLGATDLEPLFAGPRRLVHRPERAARLLAARSRGVVGQVLRELDAWVRAGRARWVAGLLEVTDELLEVTEPAPTGGPRAGRSRASDRATVERTVERGGRVLDWLVAAWPHTTPAQIARALNEPLWRVEATVAELVGASLAADDGTRVAALAGRPGLPGWSPAERRAAHARLAAALSPGAPGRLKQLAAAGDAPAVLRESLAVASAAESEGRLAEATRALIEALAVARAEGPVGVGAALEALVGVATAIGTAEALTRALYEVGRFPEGQPLEDFVRAAREAAERPSARAVARLTALPVPPALHVGRLELALRAARAVGGETEASAAAALAAAAAGDPSPDNAARAALAEGLSAYRRGAYRDALRRYEEALRTARSPWLRLRAGTSAAAAALETGAYAKGRRLAERARADAERLGSPAQEGRAEWLRRTAEYRMGRADRVDEALVAASRAVNHADVEAQIAATEAAVAWRSGALARGAELAQRAREIWEAAGWRDEALLMRALAERCAGSLHPELLTLAAGARVSGIREQVTALVTRADLPRPWPSRGARCGDVLRTDEL